MDRSTNSPLDNPVENPSDASLLNASLANIALQPPPLASALSETSDKKRRRKLILLFVGIGVLVTLLFCISAWHISTSLLFNSARPYIEIAAVESYDEVFVQIQNRLQRGGTMLIDNQLDGDQIVQGYDGSFLYGNLVNRLEISEQSLHSLVQEKGIGYAQNPSQILSFTTLNGDYLFILDYNVIHIVRLKDGASKEFVTRIELEPSEKNSSDENFTGMLLAEDRLIAIKSPLLIPSGEVPIGRNTAADIEGTSFWPAISTDPTFTTVRIFDIGTPANPQMIETYTITGTYSGSRVMGTKLYLSTSYGVYNPEAISVDEPETFIPHVISAGNVSLVKPEDIRITPDIAWRSTTYAQLLGIDVSENTNLISQVALLGDFDCIAAGKDSIFLAVKNPGFSIPFDSDSTPTSSFARIFLNAGTVSFTHTAEIPGQLGTLSENNSLLYFIPDIFFSTTGSSWSSDTTIQALVLSEQLEIVGQLETSYTTDELFPRRFMNDFLYLGGSGFGSGYGTQHLVDFSNPNEPRLIDSVTAPDFLPPILRPWIQYSTESEQRSLNNLWLGVDHKLDERFRSIGTQLIMLDQGDPLNLEEVHSIILEGHYADEAIFDSNLIFTDSARGIIALPFEKNFLIFSYDNGEGFAEIAHMELVVDPSEWGSTVRTSIVGDSMLIVQFGRQIEIWSYSLSDFSEQGRLTL
ncbi:MAG: beta-propeller domain-containing protein [Coriobacteriia bacterium]|nr:beta-propeller domain-containing protein [Coriobacteriia bacterium]